MGDSGGQTVGEADADDIAAFKFLKNPHGPGCQRLPLHYVAHPFCHRLGQVTAGTAGFTICVL